MGGADSSLSLGRKPTIVVKWHLLVDGCCVVVGHNTVLLVGMLGVSEII